MNTEGDYTQTNEHAQYHLVLVRNPIQRKFPFSCFSIPSEIAICCTQGRDYFARGWILWTIIVFLCYVFIRSFIIRAHLFCCGRVESMCLLRKIVQVTSIHLKVVKIMLLHVNVAFYCSNFASLNTLNSSRCLIWLDDNIYRSGQTIDSIEGSEPTYPP